MLEFLTSSEFWPIVFKVLLTTLVTLAIGAICTLIGKMLAKSKNSKLMKHARIAVMAAEQKFPNEGKKMGPEKMAYVMDYLAITFPKIKSNQYLYNIAEAAVYELNNQSIGEDAEQAFKDKYGELPTDIIEDKADASINESSDGESLSESTNMEAEKPISETETLSFNLKAF